MADQTWFFGRASRNILDQHIRAGQFLRRLEPTPRRVAVGDAGALMYASDLPGLDIIGLGGFHQMPFARASVHGIGATVELIERMQSADRPDVMALYPSWWADFPDWFGTHIASVWVEGNVICGGAEKAIYRTDWTLLNTGARPVSLDPGERIVDELDVADLVSEREHDYWFQPSRTGFVQMRILPNPISPSRDMLDSGRLLRADHAERFTLRAPTPGAAARMIIRSTPVDWGWSEISINGHATPRFKMRPYDGWVELSVPLQDAVAQSGSSLRVTIMPRAMREWSDYHVWLVEKK